MRTDLRGRQDSLEQQPIASAERGAVSRDPSSPADRNEGVRNGSASIAALSHEPRVDGAVGVVVAAPSYSPVFRLLEWMALINFVVMSGWLGWKLWPFVDERWPVIGVATLLAVLAMDLFAGFLHWAGDTWGSVRWPLIGSTVIRSFREHHVDPESITRHDPVEVNATNAMIAVPFLSGGLWLGPDGYFGAVFLLMFSVTGVATNQIHLWAHRRHNPWWVRALQRTRIVLSPEAHAHHHARPYTDHYCITTGWLNSALATIRFWRVLEWLISRITGAVPRDEDVRAESVLGSPNTPAL
jgi:ubiquitin-conjugating enzyme E2 variant